MIMTNNKLMRADGFTDSGHVREDKGENNMKNSIEIIKLN